MDKANKQQILRENANELYAMKKSGLNYIQMSDRMSKDYDVEIKPEDISAMFKKEEAKAFIYGSKSRKDNANYELEQLSNRYKKASDMVDWLVDSIEKIKVGLSELPPEEYAIKFIKLTPAILSISKEIINQLEYVKKEQEQMAIEQKSMMLSPIEVNIQMTKKLKEWSDKGYIKILKVISVKDENEDEKENKKNNKEIGEEKYEEAEEIPA